MSDLHDEFERRAGRSLPRGAEDVLGAARRSAEQSPGRRVPTGAVLGSAGLALALVTAVVAISGDDSDSSDVAGTPPTGAPPLVVAQNASSLVLFDDCSAALDQLKAEALERVGPYGLEGYSYWGAYYGEEDASFQRLGLPAPATRAAGEKTSQTNNQEQGVDEPDLVETDGERLYDVRGGVLRVTDLAGATVVELDLGLVNVRGAMLVDDALVVLADEPSISYGPSAGDAKVVVVDVAGAPVVRQRLTIDGALVDARTVDGRVHVVTVSAPQLELTRPVQASGQPIADAEEAAERANKERIRSSTLDDWLPSRAVVDGDGDPMGDAVVLTDCDAIHHPKEFAGFDQTSLVTLDLEDLTRSSSTSVQASSLLVYGSGESLYTATTSYQELDGIGQRRPVVAEPGTDIHRFRLGDEPTYSGSGRVEGYVDSQFGLSEHDGHLRVASTEWTDTGNANRVSVLRIDDGELVGTGVVEGLGPNEQIEGVRFVGDLGYVVTFRQTDPLYVVDLRNPAKPSLAGELQIPGYSAYLHPVGDGLLMGVGFDGTEDGVLTNAAASLFDVRDPANPQRVDVLSLAKRAPRTIDDHHAFTWWDDTATAYFPVAVWDDGNRIEVVRVDGDRLVVDAELDLGGAGAPAKTDFDRTIVIGDRLVLVSPDGVQVTDGETFEPIDWIPYG